MFKRVVSFFLVLIIFACSCSGALAIGGSGSESPNASQYLSSYCVDLVAIGNGQMSVGMEVIATGTMTKLGVLSLYIEQKNNGSWEIFDYVYGVYHSDFYMYNTNVYLGEYIFNGVAGTEYRVTMTAYARNSNGSDTGVTYTIPVTCHNP